MKEEKQAENKKQTESFLKKILKFVKKNPALSGTIATVCLYAGLIFIGCIVMVAIMYAIIAAFSSLFGIKPAKFTSGDYKEKTIVELQEMDYTNSNECYRGTSENGWSAFWQEFGDTFGVGINSECEFLDVINHEIKSYEKKYSDYNLEISPGLVISTIIYSYSSQLREEDNANAEEIVDPGDPLEVLKDIAKQGIFTVNDIEEMIDNMIIREAYWYYNCNSISCYENGKPVGSENIEDEEGEYSSEEYSSEEDTEQEIFSGKQCVRNFYFNVKFSREKYSVYLVYGVEAATYYEAAINHNKSLDYICDECYKKWNDDDYHTKTIDVSKYDIVTSLDSDAIDSASISYNDEELLIMKKEVKEAKKRAGSKYNLPSAIDFSKNEYSYKDGFVYIKFPDFKAAFDAGTLTENSYTPKTIVSSISSIISYEDKLNKILNDDFIENGGNPNPSLTGEDRAKRECPSEEACNCSNGNITPATGSSGGGAAGSNSASCKYVLDAASVMIRLYGCTTNALTNPQSKMPGGAHEGTVKGKTVWIANDAISFEQYVKYGIMAEPTLSKMKVGGLAVHMVLYQSYALSYIERHPELIQENGEIYVENGSCMQNYNESLLTNPYSMSFFHVLDESYDIAKTLIIANASGVIPFFQYNNTFSKSLEGVDGDIAEIYNKNVLNYPEKPGPQLRAASATLQDCLNSSSESGDFGADAGATTTVGASNYYNLMSPKKGIFGSFPYHDSAAANDTSNRNSITMDPKWKSANLSTVSKDCGNGLSMNWTVHKLAKTAFTTVQEKMCEITTTGIDGIVYSPSEITFSGPLNVRYVSNTKTISLHSWGIAIDVNPNKKYTVNGKTYSPYGRSKPDKEDIGLRNYLSFVNALGSESDKRNINYILWTKIFKPAGFRWGGNWGRNGDSSTYDGMHFEIDWRQTQ